MPWQSVLVRARRGVAPPILVTRFDPAAGEDLLGRDELVAELTRAVLGDDPSVFGRTTFDAPSVTLDEVLDAGREVSLLAPRRLVLVRGSRLAAGSEVVGEDEDSPDGGYGADEAPPSASERGGEDAQLAVLARYLERAAAGACIAFVGCPWDARRRIHKAVLAAATVADVSRPDPRQVPGWIESRVRAGKGRIEPDAAALLAELRGNDTMRLGAEIEKLLLYTGGSRAIGTDDVLSLVAAGEAPTAWALVDAVADGDARRALPALTRLLEEGEAPPAIVGALASRLRQMIVLSDEKTTRRENDAARAIVFPGRSIYFADALSRKSGRFSPQALARALSELYDIDRRTKSSSLDPGALLEEWLVSLLQTSGSVRS